MKCRLWSDDISCSTQLIPQDMQHGPKIDPLPLPRRRCREVCSYCEQHQCRQHDGHPGEYHDCGCSNHSASNSRVESADKGKQCGPKIDPGPPPPRRRCREVCSYCEQYQRRQYEGHPGEYHDCGCINHPGGTEDSKFESPDNAPVGALQSLIDCKSAVQASEDASIAQTAQETRSSAKFADGHHTLCQSESTGSEALQSLIDCKSAVQAGEDASIAQTAQETRSSAKFADGHHAICQSETTGSKAPMFSSPNDTCVSGILHGGHVETTTRACFRCYIQ